MFNSGGNYSNTTNAGVFYSNGNNNSRTNTSANIGFRSVLPRYDEKPGGPRPPVQVRGKGSVPRAEKQKRKIAAVPWRGEELPRRRKSAGANTG